MRALQKGYIVDVFVWVDDLVANNRKRALMAEWQQLLLAMRQKVEATFGKLKEQHFLVTSFPRSVEGYFVHYLRVLLWLPDGQCVIRFLHRKINIV